MVVAQIHLLLKLAILSQCIMKRVPQVSVFHSFRIQTC